MSDLNTYKTKILSFYGKYKRMPSYGEICELLGFKSKNAAFKLVKKLVEGGVLARGKAGRIIPKNISNSIPVLGLVEAGIPTVADEVNLDTMSIDEYLISDSAESDTYLLEVKGDSMIEAGIREKDLVLAVRIKREPKEGEIVIAEVDGGWTMKYFRKKNGKPYLEPANKKYKPIYPENDLNIHAVVKGVIRKY